MTEVNIANIGLESKNPRGNEEGASFLMFQKPESSLSP